MEAETERTNDEARTETAPIEAAEREASQTAAIMRRYRDLLVAANPDAVAELIQGADPDQLESSVAAAKAAFARAKEAARAELATSPTPMNPGRREGPPAGLESAGPLAKIAWGLRDLRN